MTFIVKLALIVGLAITTTYVGIAFTVDAIEPATQLECKWFDGPDRPGDWNCKGSRAGVLWGSGVTTLAVWGAALIVAVSISHMRMVYWNEAKDDATYADKNVRLM